MRTFFSLALLASSASAGLILTGVVDGPLSAGIPMAAEFYATTDIPDLSVYGIASSNNGGGVSGPEFTFPADTASAGDFIYVASVGTNFAVFFGFLPDYTSTALVVNGDDAIVLYEDGIVIDVFGDVNVDGTGTVWEYVDGWAYRQSGTGPDGSTFFPGSWTYSGINALDGAFINARAEAPFPLGTYTPPAPTAAPVAPTKAPTLAPSSALSSAPSAPTGEPSSAPSLAPSDIPSEQPSSTPSSVPTRAPTSAPTGTPTRAPWSERICLYKVFGEGRGSQCYDICVSTPAGKVLQAVGWAPGECDD